VVETTAGDLGCSALVFGSGLHRTQEKHCIRRDILYGVTLAFLVINEWGKFTRHHLKKSLKLSHPGPHFALAAVGMNIEKYK
jgi:hypothetical protein